MSMATSGKDTMPSTPKKSAPSPWKIPPQEEWTDEMWEIAEAVQEMAREQNGAPADLLKELHDSMEQGMKAQYSYQMEQQSLSTMGGSKGSADQTLTNGEKRAPSSRGKNADKAPSPLTSESPADFNAPETEQDAIRAEGLRRLRVRQMFKGRQDQTPKSSQSQKPTPNPKA